MVAYSLLLNDFVLKLSIFCDIHEEGLEQLSLEISKTVFHGVEPYFDDVCILKNLKSKIEFTRFDIFGFYSLVLSDFV